MKCELCGSDRRNSIQYGEFLTNKGKGVHINCLYLSSGLQQSGSENEGILGFLPKDIAAERARVSRIECCFCGKLRANIGCCGVRCYRTFHMICGIENDAMNQFLDTFRSFCDRHVRKVRFRPKKDDVCYICYEKMFNECKRFSAVKMIRAPCCRNGWFHKYCLQKFAKSAGYFFKCPLCNDSQNFKNHMSYWGIFVQDKDAEWELVPNAFADLLERPSVCEAQMCHNAEGREQSNDTNPFLYCVTCGSVAIHRHCVPLRGSSFECDHCQQILNGDSGRESLSSQQQYTGQAIGVTVTVDEDENSDVDVCGEIDEYISDELQEKSDDEVLRPNIQRRNILRISDDTEGESSSEVEDCIVMGSAQKMAADKRGVLEGCAKESECNNEKLNCVKKNELCASNNATDISDDEGLVNSFEDGQKTHDSSWSETEICIAVNEQISTTYSEPQTVNNMEPQRQPQNFETDEETKALDVSCIAYRTRRRSSLQLQNLSRRPFSVDCAEFTYDDMSSISSESSYRQPKMHNVGDLNTSCIAKRICRRFNKFDVIGDGKEKNVLDVSYIAKRTRRKYSSSIANNNNATNDQIETDTTTHSTTSTNESFKSCTYLSTTFEYSYENYIESSSDEDISNTNESADWNRASTSKDRAEVKPMVPTAQKRKVGFDIPMPSKIPALTTNECEPEAQNNNFGLSCIANRTRRKSMDHKNVFEESCIANRKRRKSVDANTFIQILNVEENKETHATGNEQAAPSKSISLPNYATEPESHANIFELSCIANRTRRKSVDANRFNQIVNVEENNETFAIESESVPATPIPATLSIHSSPESRSSDVIIIKTPSSTQSSQSSSISPVARRGQRIRRRPRHFQYSQDNCNNAKSSIVHSPMPQIGNCSNLKEKNKAYFMPRYMRVDGKLKRVPAEAFQPHRQQPQPQLQQQQRSINTRTPFPRSYNILLQSTNINRRASINRT